MKKFGYSLAETLIALMIVGVVAALTIPGLVKSNENKSNAAALSVAVSDFENALANMMISDEVDKLFKEIGIDIIKKYVVSNKQTDNIFLN